MIALHVLLLTGLLFFFARRIDQADRVLFWCAWLFRLFMSVALGWVYAYYYEANDTWHFFEDATRLSALARTDVVSYLHLLIGQQPDPEILQTLFHAQERSLFLVKGISLLALISGDNYWTCALYTATFAFGASWYFFRIVNTYFDQARLPAAVSFLFFPSVVFWSSGLVKETWALAGILIITAVLFQVMKGDKITVWHGFGCVVAGWVSWNLKYYWAALFLVSVLTTLLVFVVTKRTRLKRYGLAVWGFVFLVAALVATRLHPNLHLERVLEVVVANHQAFVKISRPEGLIHFNNLQPDWWSMLANAPLAIVSALFRPWIGEAHGLTGWVAALENLVLAVLLVTACFRKTWNTTQGLLLTASVVYIVLECVLMAISAPNLGTLSRYRVGFLPFFVFLMSYGNPLIAKIRLLTSRRRM